MFFLVGMRQVDKTRFISKVAAWTQLAWSIFIFLTLGLAQLGSEKSLAFGIGILSIVYVFCSGLALAENRIGWLVALLVSVFPLTIYLPLVAVNFYMFFTGHELYRDSPLTIVIVLMYAVAYVFPAAVIYTLVFAGRKEIFRNRTLARDKRISGNLARCADENDKNPYAPPSSAPVCESEEL